MLVLFVVFSIPAVSLAGVSYCAKASSKNDSPEGNSAKNRKTPKKEKSVENLPAVEKKKKKKDRYNPPAPPPPPVGLPIAGTGQKDDHTMKDVQSLHADDSSKKGEL